MARLTEDQVRRLLLDEKTRKSITELRDSIGEDRLANALRVELHADELAREILVLRSAFQLCPQCGGDGGWTGETLVRDIPVEMEADCDYCEGTGIEIVACEPVLALLRGEDVDYPVTS